MKHDKLIVFIDDFGSFDFMKFHNFYVFVVFNT